MTNNEEKKPALISVATIGMTAYNWIAIQDGGRTLSEVLAGIHKDWAKQNSWATEVTEERLEQALAVLLSKRLLSFKDERFDVCDPKRRVVIARDRSDKIGWNGWMVAKHETTKRIPIESAVELN